jgi:hypothetical protein
MTVAELVELLRTLPPDMSVAYVNRCADDGAELMTVTEAEIRAGNRTGYGSCDYPAEGVVVLE